MKVKKSLLKLMTVFGIVFLLIWTINRITFNTFYNSYIDNINETNKKIKDSEYYFMGSSRVQSSIDPQEVTTIFKDREIVNLGLSGSSFIGSSLLTNSIMKNNKGVFFIELSPALIELSQTLVLFADESGFDLLEGTDNLFQNENSYNTFSYTFKTYKSYLFQKFSNRGKLKHFFFDRKEAIIGYKFKTNQSKLNATSSFLTYEEMMETKKPEIRLDSYKNYINYLTDLGVKYNSKVVFFLPITYKHIEEKNRIIPLFQSLPDSLKITYSKEFLKEITNSDYLYDINHLNSKGAKIYSQWLGEYLKSNFKE